MNLHEIAKEFMLLEAASGYEKKMSAALASHLSRYSSECAQDAAGNVIAKFPGTNSLAPTVMVFAHMDQVGFIVRKIEEDGLIQVDRMGGIPEKVLPALQLSVANINGEYYPGVFGVKSHHATAAEEKYKVDPVTSLFVDIGAASKRQVLDAGIRVGCPIIYKPSFINLLGDRISGTTVDNRCGCAALVSIAETLRAGRNRATVYLVGTVLEEFNLRGGMLAARSIHPDLAICLDVVLSGDTPDLKGKYDTRLGAGPAVGLYNFHGRGTLNGAIAHHGLYRLALKCAEQNNMPLQEFAALGMLTDSAYVQLEGHYTACLDMGYPARYTHSPAETADIGDVRQLADLVSHMVCEIDAGFDTKRF